MTMTRALALATCLLLAHAGCGGSYPAAQGSAHPKGAQGGKQPAHGGLDIRKASMPYKVLRARGGQEVDEDAFLSDLDGARAVCLGESHSNPHDHWVQLMMVEKLAGRARGRAMALGMEMFQRPFQGVLDDYAAGRIDEAALLSRTGWDARWGFDFALYRPIVEVAVARGMALLALNMASELHQRVTREGVDALAAAERASVPELVLDDAEHRAWFAEAMRGAEQAHGMGHGHAHEGEDAHGGEHGSEHGSEHGHGHGGRAGKDYYLAQVLWDEAMADAAAGWLAGGEGRQVVILAGKGHCHDSAMVRRIARRGAGRVVSVHTVMDEGDSVAAALARPLTDYLIVLSVQSAKK
jgi:uncharacterized iron-regulated protein